MKTNIIALFTEDGKCFGRLKDANFDNYIKFYRRLAANKFEDLQVLIKGVPHIVKHVNRDIFADLMENN